MFNAITVVDIENMISVTIVIVIFAFDFDPCRQRLCVEKQMRTEYMPWNHISNSRPNVFDSIFCPRLTSSSEETVVSLEGPEVDMS